MPTKRSSVHPNVEPVLLVPRAEPSDDPAYLCEPKHDGFRGLLYVTRKACWIRSKRVNVLTRTLEAEGYEVMQVRNGREALESLARSGRVDVVLTDVVMPQVSGRELVERLALEYPDVPVIWMSGYPRDAAFGDGASGAHSFLQKPIPQDVLVRTVEGILGRRGGGPGEGDPRRVSDHDPGGTAASRVPRSSGGRQVPQ